MGEEGGGAHLERVLHFDDATVQDGGAHRGDLDGPAVPRLPALGAHDVAAERAHHGALLLHGAAGDERLRLDDVGFGHHGAGGGVVELGEHGDHLACGEGARVRRLSPTCEGGGGVWGGGGSGGSGLARRTHRGCSLCGRSWR